MKKLSVVLSTIIIVFTCSVFSQPSVTVFGKAMYNGFDMGSLKDFQSELLHDITAMDIPAEIVDDYPPYFGGQGGMLLSFHTFQFPLSVGAFIDYASTGARINYQDYSGKINIDQYASSVSIGGTADITQEISERFHIDYSIAGRFIFSSYKVHSLTQIQNSSQTNELKFSSFSIGLEPNIMLSYKVFRNVSIGVSGSYLLALPTTLEYDQLQDAYLVNKKGEKVSIDWSGFKAGTGVYFTF